MRDGDADRIAPGGEDIDRLLDVAGGGLIILDEVVNYIEKAAAVAVRDSTLKAQTLTFLQTPSSRAGAHDRVVVAATLPRATWRFTGPRLPTRSIDFRRSSDACRKCARPVEGDEVHEIIRRRLFAPFGEDTGEKSKRSQEARGRDATIAASVRHLSKTR